MPARKKPPAAETENQNLEARNWKLRTGNWKLTLKPTHSFPMKDASLW
jgi:hypothetical protein